MKAVKLPGHKKAITIDVPVPELREGYCLIKVVASGICGSDVERLFNSNEEVKYIPGHEAAGTVVEKNNVDGFSIGDRVMISINIGCGECKYCKNGKRLFCKQVKIVGFDLDGTDAEYIALPEMCLIKIPDDISFEQAMLLTDALGTPYAASIKADIQQGDNVAVMGAGSLGMMACLSSRYFGARVFAIDILPGRLKFAAAFGIDHVINPDNDDVDEILKKYTDDGFDIVIECSGSERAIRSALKYTRPEGKIIQVGVCPRVEIDTDAELIKKEITLIGSRGLLDSQVDDVVGLIRKNPDITKIITHRFPLDKAQEAFDAAAARTGLKVIFTP